MEVVMLRSIAGICGVALIAAACSQATYDRASDYKLCKHYLTKPPFNIHFKGVVRAIEKRGIECDQYLDRALADKAAEEAAAAAYSSSSTSRRVDDLEDELDQLKSDRAWKCIADGGVMVGNTCMD